MGETALVGCRVLVVEDELMIAMLVETVLEEAQCTIVGPYGDLAAALEAARSEVLDLAVLDINLAGEMVFPVADVLDGRGVPFLLLSGYGETGLPSDRRHWPVCSKPFKLDELLSMLKRLVAASGKPS
jgi:DNA-binding response OmpR family regulator